MKAGDKVAVGDPLMVMIAMKMEVKSHSNTRLTHSERVVTLIFVSAAHDPGAQVRRHKEGFLQRGLSGQSPRSLG